MAAALLAGWSVAAEAKTDTPRVALLGDSPLVHTDRAGSADSAGRARPLYDTAVSGGRVVVAWEDERDWPGQIFVARARAARIR